MIGLDLIRDLAVVLLAAGLAGWLCRRAGLSVVVGYVVAGVVVGPFTPPFSFVSDVGRIQTLSQIGLVFLMFGIGLGLSLTRLQRLGLGLLVATGLGAFFMLQAGRLVGLASGGAWGGSWFLAGMAMVSSSAVIAKMVAEMNLRHTRAGQVALAITVLEDVVAMGTTGGGGGVAWGGLLAGLSAFVVLLISTGLFVLPKLLRRLGGRADPELQTITVAGLLLFLAWLAARAGYSPALGAFLLGAMVAEMPQRPGVERAFAGAKDMFSSVFFVAIGMMIDVRVLAEVWWVVLLAGGLIMALRAGAVSLALTLVGQPPEVARRAALLVTPIGEFSFVIAQLGVTAGLLDPRAYPVAVGVSLLTVLVAPALNRRAEAGLAQLRRMEPAWWRRWEDGYRMRLARLADARLGGMWWQVCRKRVLQIAGEMLLVTGVLLLATEAWLALQGSTLIAGLPRRGVELGFVVVVAGLIVVPLVALGRNLAVLSLITADVVAGRTGWSERLLASGLQFVAAVVVTGWLAEVMPWTLLPWWAWVVGAIVIVAAMIFLFRRLVYWHSEWQHSVEGGLAGKFEAETDETPRWWTDAGDWQLEIKETTLPERAVSAGQTLNRLGLRSRLGVSVTEINRQGIILMTPGPDEVLYPGDRLLLLGPSAGLDVAASELQAEQSWDSSPFDDARLHQAAVKAGSPLVGLALGTWQAAGPGQHPLLVGIERDGRRIVHPSAEEVIQAHDLLLLLGTNEQVRRWREEKLEPGVADK